MSRLSLIFGAGLLWIAGCGESGATAASSTTFPPPGHGGGGPGGGGPGGAGAGGLVAAGGGGASPFLACGPGESRAFGTRLDPEHGCLDTGSAEEVGCAAPPDQDGYSCLERIADGARFWLLPYVTLRWDAAVFRSCPSVPPAPPACFNRSCSASLKPVSFCTPEETRKQYACGSPGSRYDAGCCLRPLCSQGVCAGGLHCVTINTFAAHGCILANGECACLQTPGGQTADVCVEDGE